MEGERRKRKLESGHEEENEEQKMEKFFALIKSTKDARDHLFDNKDKKAEEEQKGEGIWTPAFQPEDFIDYGGFGKSNIVSTTTQAAGPSEEEKEKEKEKGKGKEKEVMIEREYLQEASPAVVAPAQENHDPEEKEKASDPLDLNLSL